MTLVNLDDNVDIQMTNLAARYTNDDSYNEDQRGLLYPRAIHSNVTGTVYVVPVGNADAHSVPLKLNAGSTYSYAIRRFLSTGASGVTSGQIIAIR